MRYPETPVPAHLEIISPTGEIGFYSLNPGGRTRLGQRPENELALEGPGIAPFHFILDHRLLPYRLLLLSQEETWLNGQPLSPHSIVELQPLDLIKVGGYMLVLLAGPLQAKGAAAPPQFNPPSLLHEDPLRVNLSAHHAWVEVAQTAIYRAALVNNTSHKITARINVEGIEQSWLTITPAQVKLMPGEQGVVALSILPLPSPGSSAGSHSFRVVVTSPDYPGWRTTRDVSLFIKPQYDFTLSDLIPKQQHLSRFQQVGQTSITLTNKSNCPVRLQLSGADTANVCHFEFQLPEESASLVATATLQLLAGQTVSIPIRVTPPPRPWIRPGRCSYPYTLSVTLLEGRPLSRILSGQVTSAPLIGPWLIALTIFCLVGLAMWGTRLFLEQTWLRPVFLSRVTPTPARLPARPLATAAPAPTALPAVTPALTYEEIFQKVALQYNLDWRVLAEVAYRESRLNPLAVGRNNDMGLMQIIPATWNEWAPKVGVSDPFDPYSNVQVAGAYLAYLRGYCQARGFYETRWMLVGYNWGPKNIQELFESRGGWDQVPEKQRQYALVIMEAASRPTLHWEERAKKTVDSALNY